MPKKTDAWPTQKERPLILCHFGAGEIQGMDDMQGGPSFDEYGIREYSKLGKIIKIPEVRKLFMDMESYGEKNKGALPPEIKSAYDQVKPYAPKYPESEKENHYPMIKNLKEKGIGGDKEIAWVPEDLVEFFIELRHEPQINPKTGILMFAFWKQVIRVGGTIVGAFLGGPIGAGVGSFAARHATGQHGARALKGAIGDFGKAAAVSGIGHVVGSFFPSVAAAGRAALPSALSSAGSDFFNGPMSTAGMLKGAGSMLGFGNAGAAAPLVGSTNLPNGQWDEATARARGDALSSRGRRDGQSPSFLSSILGNGNLMLPLMGGAYYLTKQQEAKQNRKAYEDAMNRYRQKEDDMGMNKPWVDIPALNRTKNPAFYNRSEMEREYGIYPTPFHEDAPHYASGGHAHINHADIQSHSRGALIKGPGKGQDDYIDTHVPENSYILDATTVSSFGDGSSEAGGRILKRFEHDIKSRNGKPHREIVEQYTKQLPVYLSNDEYKFDPETVTAIGRGNNDKGAKILKSMVLELRKDKSRNGIGLAPKSKDPMHYVEKAFQQLMKGKRHAK